jgi:uncharacterized protein YjbJ (UPF0337 family)
MNWDIVKGNWKQIKGKGREEWGELTHDEWDQIGGNFEQFVGKVQEKYGWNRNEAEKRANDWADRHAKSDQP